MTIAVCSITYNQEAFAEDLVNCLLGQTVVPDEVIIIDDCSPDETCNKIMKLLIGQAESGKELKTKFRIIRNEANIGASRALDKAISLATCDYVAILEGDDYFKPAKLEESIKFLEENNLEFMHTEIDDLYESGEILENGWKRAGINLPSVMSLDNLRGGNRIYTSTVVAKREVLQSSPGFSGFTDLGYTVLGDYPLFLWIANKYPIGYLDRNLTVKRYIGISLGHGNPLTAQEHGRAVGDIERIVSV
jgi:glycosyltransferase involved in cell wall biosynthesis